MEMYSPVRGKKIRNDEEVLHRGVRTYCMAKGDLEAMLKERWPDKLQPVTSKLGSHKRVRQDNKKDILLPGSHTFTPQ